MGDDKLKYTVLATITTPGVWEIAGKRITLEPGDTLEIRQYGGEETVFVVDSVVLRTNTKS